MPTVDVQPVPDLPAVKMIWQKQVTSTDVAAAFRTITAALDASGVPMYVIVDLKTNPNFPLVTTIQEALIPYRHAQLKEWLVVGSSWMAQTIEGTLSRITQHKSVRWFNTEAEALVYLQESVQVKQTS